MATINPIKGTKAPVDVTITNLPGGAKLSDSSINVRCEFYIKGKRHAEGQVVTIAKDADMTKVNDDTYKCVVDTTAMSVGELMCEATITSSSNPNLKWVLNCTTNVRVDESK